MFNIPKASQETTATTTAENMKAPKFPHQQHNHCWWLPKIILLSLITLYFLFLSSFVTPQNNNDNNNHEYYHGAEEYDGGVTMFQSTETIAGNPYGRYGDGGPAIDANLNRVIAAIRYPKNENGDLYIADYHHYMIRKVSAVDGTISTIAGNGVEGYSGDGGLAVNARISRPRSIFITDNGDIYIADQYNHRVRKIEASTGKITTVAGNGTPGFSGDGGLATSAQLQHPAVVYVTNDNEMYISDESNNRVRKVFANGTIVTIAGNGGSNSQISGIARDMPLFKPYGLSVVEDEVYVVAGWGQIAHKILTNGTMVTIAGNGTGGYSPDGTLATESLIDRPYEIEVFDNEVYILMNHALRKILTNGTMVTIAGSSTRGFSGDGGPAKDARLSDPQGLYVNEDEIIIADYSNDCVRKVWSDGTITRVVGDSSLGDGHPATRVSLTNPQGLALTSNGEVLIADTNNNKIRKVVNGTMTTLLTNLSRPRGVAVSPNGDIYVADTNNHVIKRIGSNGVMKIIAGSSGNFGDTGDGGDAINALLNTPSGIAIADDGVLYIADSGNNRIRKIVNGTIYETEIALLPVNPSAISVLNGEVYIADTVNNCIRKFDTNGDAALFAGGGNAGYFGDGGPATSAHLNQPEGVFATEHGVYISDTGNNRIRKVLNNGTIITIAGNGDTEEYGEGEPGINASFNQPRGIVVAGNGDVYIVDSGHNRIRKISNVPLKCFGVSATNNNVCSGRGQCTKPNHCECEYGYGGIDCSLPICYGILANNESVCSGEGVCGSPNNCTCYSGFSGLECSKLELMMKMITNGTEDQCYTPIFVATVPNRSLLHVHNFTWHAYQDGHIVDQRSVSIDSNGVSYFFPNIGRLMNGELVVEAEMYFIARFGELDSRTSQVTSQVHCTFCLDGGDGCRYQIQLDPNLSNNTVLPIARMIPFRVKYTATDKYSDDIRSQGFETKWITSFNTTTWNITISSSSNGTLRIAPRDPMIGMDASVDISVTLQFKIAKMELQFTTFQLRTIPSKVLIPLGDSLMIEPEVGFSLQDIFQLSAMNWNNSNGRLLFTFSYLDQMSDHFVRLSESKINTFKTVLPSGRQPTNNLLIRLSVFDPVTGDSGHAEKNVTVKKASMTGLTHKLDEAIENGNYTTVLTIATRIGTGSDQELKQNHGELKLMVTRMLAYTSTLPNDNSVLVDQKLWVIDLVTKSNILINDQDIALVLNVALDVLETDISNSSTTLVSKMGYQNIANVISNVATNGFRNGTIATAILRTASSLSTLIESTLTIDDEPVDISSDTFRIIITVGIHNHTIGDQHVSIPSDFSSQIGGGDITSSILIFNDNPYQSLSSTTTSKKEAQVSSAIIDVKFKNYGDQSIIPVANLPEPLLIYFNRSHAQPYEAEATFRCQYWNEENKQWQSDGCFWKENDSNSSDYIACACNHTTSFSAFILEKGDTSVRYEGIKITDIVFNSLYLLVCIPILIGLFLVRKHQPLKSRFIAPFLGISSIIVDSALQGIIRNSLSLSMNQAASDAFSYVIILTANPLLITALFVFLWQHVRFILLQNIYHLMPVRGSAFRQRFIRLNKVLSSKLVFSVVAIVVGSVTMSLFAILVGLAAHYNRIEAKRQRDIVVMTQAIVFASMILCISVALFIALIFDILLSSSRKSKAQQNKKQEPKSGKEAKLRFNGTVLVDSIRSYFANDPLLFRTELLIILFVVLIIIVLYSIGIVTVVRQPTDKHPIMIARTTLELLFLLLRIVAFGGFQFGVTLKWFIAAWRRQSSEYESVGSSTRELEHDEKVLTVLKHEHGFQLLFNYCMLEFSLENILLWQELESIRPRNNAMTTDERRQMLQELKQLYIDANSERQLNLSGKPRKMFLNVAKLSEPSATDAEPVLAQLHLVCLTNLQDTLIRLCTTEAYIAFEEAMKTNVELGSDFESPKSI